MNWLSSLLLAWPVLQQVVLAAEQRSLLRARRAGEAMPVITLPDSLLLQSGDEEGTADEVVEGARRAYFATEKAAKSSSSNATNATNATNASNATSAVVATTTTAPLVPTTQDPAVLARQQGISLEAAQARNMLVGMIARAQIGLLKRLDEISMDLDATELRAKQDLKAINHSFATVNRMPIMAANADAEVTKIGSNGVKLKAALPSLLSRANSTKARIAKFTKLKTDLDTNLAKIKIKGAKRRVQNNAQTLKVLYPRLVKLEKRVTKLEGQLYEGNLTKLVDEATGTEVVNIMEDVSRGFGRFFENSDELKR